MEKSARIAAKEAAAAGLHWTFAPMMMFPEILVGDVYWKEQERILG